MPDTLPARKLSHDGALRLIQAGAAEAARMSVPQCIAVVDDGGNLLAFLRMDGASFLSVDSAIAKAVTAAARRRPTGSVSAETELKLAIAMQGRFTNLKGGLPIVVDGQVVGGIGVGSGTGDQDVQVAQAALAAIGAAAG